jgi:hypothetical protein
VNPAHLHLIANHVPIFAAALAIPLLLVALWRRDESGTFLAAVLFLVIAGVGAIVAERSGHAAEEIVEELPGIEERLIHEHEERAEVALWLTVASAALGIATLAVVWRRRPFPVWSAVLLLAAALVTTGAMAWTSLAGGEIRHPEIRASDSDLPDRHHDHDDHDDDD